MHDEVAACIPPGPEYDGLRRVWEKYKRHKTAPPAPSLNAKRPCLGCQRITQSKYRLCLPCQRHEIGARRREGDLGRGLGHPGSDEGRSGAAVRTSLEREGGQ